MPKQVKHERKAIQDVNQWARDLVDRSTANKSTEPTSDEVSRVMAMIGAKGGRIGGKRRLETMTADQRSEAASKAARAMWAKRKRVKKR